MEEYEEYEMELGQNRKNSLENDTSKKYLVKNNPKFLKIITLLYSL